jgi:hypothetical protein
VFFFWAKRVIFFWRRVRKMARTINKMPKRVPWRKARKTLELRNEVFFNGDLMGVVMLFCTLSEQRRTKITCSAVHELDFSAAFNYAAGSLFSLQYPLAYEDVPPNSEFKTLRKWRRAEKLKFWLTYKKNTRAAKKERDSQTQYTKTLTLVGGKLELEVLFKDGLLEIFGMNEEDETAVLPQNIRHYQHNMVQWLDVLDDCSESEIIFVSHLCGRPLSSFEGIAGVKAFVAALTARTYFTLGVVVLPCDDMQFPNECYIQPDELEYALNDTMITI